MDLNDYWQENKRFLVAVGVGLFAFLIGNIIVDAAFGSELRAAERRRGTLRRSLREPRYSNAQRREVQAENESLREAFEVLGQAVAFQPRPEFQLRAGSDASNQFFTAVERVREQLTLLASRERMTLPDNEGIQIVKTNSVEIIVRHFEALDVIDRVVHVLAEAGVKQIRAIKVDLDPAFGSRSGLGALEKTRVEFSMVADAEAVTRALSNTQGARYGQVLPIEQFEIKSARSKKDEVRVDVTFLVVRLRESAGADEEDL